MILYEGGELWPELASCHFSFPSGQSIVTVLQRDGICWRGKRVNTAAMMTQHNRPGNGLSCFSCALYPSTAGGHISQSGVRVKWPPQSGEAGRGREHCHLVISRHTAINTSYFSPGLANWTNARECVVRREEETENLNKLIKSTTTTISDHWLTTVLSAKYEVWWCLAESLRPRC